MPYQDFIAANVQSAFNISNALVMPAWLMLAIAPKSKFTRWAVRAAVLFNSAMYLGMLPSILGGPDGFPDFRSLDGIVKLFRTAERPGLLGAWNHYLAFDLIVGQAIARDAVLNDIPRYLVAPALFGTLMAGPTGVLLYGWLKFVSGRLGSDRQAFIF
ncbi:hypothetical protein RI367_005737 [Sorochytrium milnesiophthora]